MNRVSTFLSAACFGVAAFGVFATPAHAAPDDRKWKSTQVVESHDSGDAFTPQVAFDHDGNAIAVWLLSDGATGHVFASRYTVSGKHWDAPFQLEASVGTGGSAPQVAVDALGNAIAVWSQSDGVQARRYSDGNWSAIKPLQATAGSGSDPQIAFDANGNAIAAWSQRDGAQNHVWASRYSKSSDQWDTAVPLESNSGDATVPQIAVDANGDALVVWRQSTGGPHTDIWANRYTMAGPPHWMGAQPIENNAGSASAPQVAMGGGTGRAVWFEFDTDAGRNRVWSSRYTASTDQWDQIAPIESNTGNASSPQLALDASGNAVAVWHQFDGQRSNIWSNRYVASTASWEGAVLIDGDNTGDAFSPSIAMDANGNALAVWHQKQPDADVFGIWAARSTPGLTLGTSWAPPALIERDNNGDAFLPRVAFDATGAALAVWYRFDGTRFSIASNRYSVREWGPAERLDMATGSGSMNPQIVVEGNGNALAVWEQWHDQIGTIHSKRYTVGSGWGEPTTISGSTGSAHDARIAVDGLGNVLAVWIVWDGTVENVWANRYRPDAPGTGWGEAARIQSEHPEGFASDVELASNANGAAVAVWWQLDETGTSVWAKRYTPGIGWKPSEMIAGDGNSDPKIAIDANGNALLVWNQIVSNRVDLVSSRSMPSGGWGPATLVETNNKGNVGDADLAIDATGNALAVWYQFDKQRLRSIWANRYTAGVGWGTAELLETDDSGAAGSARVALDANGNGLALWSQSDASRRASIWSNRYSAADRKWEGRRLVETDTSGPAAVPVFAFDANANPAALWIQSTDGSHFNLWANRYTAGSLWGTAVQIVPYMGDGGSLEQRLAFDANGNALAVWHQHSDSDQTWHVWFDRYE
jgi:hypothetical protein